MIQTHRDFRAGGEYPARGRDVVSVEDKGAAAPAKAAADGCEQADEGYRVHSPRSTVRTLYGEEYPIADYSDPDHVKRVERQSLLADGAYMDGLALHVIDRPGRYIRETLRNLVWRVSPSGPRALHLLGTDTELAWSVNRTRVVSMLTELGQLDLAASYLEFYSSGWEYFLSGYEDSDAGRSTVSAAVETLTIAREIAEHWPA